MVQHFKEITTFPSFHRLLRRDYIWESIKNISIQVILNSDQRLNTSEAILHSFHLNQTYSWDCDIHLCDSLFLRRKMGMLYFLNWRESCSEVLTGPPCSYASLELQRQMGTCQNIFPCSLVNPHSVAALNQNNDLSLFGFPRDRVQPH